MLIMDSDHNAIETVRAKAIERRIHHGRILEFNKRARKMGRKAALVGFEEMERYLQYEIEETIPSGIVSSAGTAAKQDEKRLAKLIDKQKEKEGDRLTAPELQGRS